MTQNTKQIIIAIVIIVIAFIGFKMFFPKGDSADISLTPDINNQVYIKDGPATLALLNRLNNVELDDSIFSNKIFVSLKSFERELEVQTPGRNNPFLPIGMNGSGTIIPRSTSTSPVR
jgi:hypothetical protein